ncbi:hypothetical protein P22_3745 [Propionispora sp. 2/2-37]|uniref:sigma-54-dependent transcriptional regulator n=1 Tax=Propionispora sp. 2/2-37 TaxID=1677858 RepID=UPI0006BFE8DD|nr:sigma-54-dependent transcriptional regulator [Propionispora sp. 2/2-37]CUH97613.1 hypothetical protein P22_3745 [Propionispora sp. 2/2-37]
MLKHHESAANDEMRKDKVLKILLQFTEPVVNEIITANDKIGFSAKDIADSLQLLRNNVSMELNILVREKKAVKITGKPVLYLAVLPLEAAYDCVLESVVFKDFSELQASLLHDASKMEESILGISKNMSGKHAESKGETAYGNRKQDSGIFESVFGVYDDLQVQIKQAKAAILYPPNGLHTLIIGPTGSGKTTFAGVMYRYAVENGRLPANAPYIIFNCADYAENKQLLLSHLFGHVKGAYTGAEREKKGLVDQADGGILFLDEIHRLPPEGQEMLFSLIDRGEYRRLGETEGVRSANVLIIAATTEAPQSAVLSTFLRRIPLIITLPSISERPLKVRMLLICQFFREESMKIKVPLTVSKEVLKVLLIYKCQGNIGQLRNDIQLLCANAFIEYITAREEAVYVKLSQLTDQLKEGIFAMDEKRQEIMQNFNLNDCGSITFSGNENNLSENLNDIMLFDEYQIGEDFYEFILENAQKLYSEGHSIREIKENISAEMQLRLHQTLGKAKAHNVKMDQEILSKIATPDIVNIIEAELKAAPHLLGHAVDTKVIYGLALHMETLIERLRQGHITIYPDIAKVSNKYPEEYKVAGKIKLRVERALHIHIPNDETAFIAVFLHSMQARESGKVQVVVMAHGHSTASNMVEVAKVLLGYDCIHALDMPMESKVEETLEEAVKLVQRIHQGSGVLFLVDMGSLTTFPEIITKRTGVPTRMIRMVSTPMVIEAARKAMLPNMTLQKIEESVLTMSSFIGERVKVEEVSSANKIAEIEPQISIKPLSGRVISMLANVLVFLNIHKTCKVLEEIFNGIIQDYRLEADDTICLKFYFHCACMLERIIRKEPLPYNNFASVKQEKSELFQIIKERFILAEEVFGVSLPDTEIAYIVEMILLHYNLANTE